MDNSKEYIAMCKAAEEIQDNWHMYNGDFFYSKNGQNSPEFCISIWLSGSKRCNTVKDKTWLPRQDQLQKMYLDERVSIFKLLHKFNTFIFYPEEGTMLFKKYPQYQLNSAEQLWLAFIMQERYRKRWKGEKWEEI